MKRKDIQVTGVMMWVLSAVLAAGLAAQTRPAPPAARSEERRVGKECRL